MNTGWLGATNGIAESSRHWGFAVLNPSQSALEAWLASLPTVDQWSSQFQLRSLANCDRARSPDSGIRMLQQNNRKFLEEPNLAFVVLCRSNDFSTLDSEA
jgi:hypothetical protein